MIVILGNISVSLVTKPGNSTGGGEMGGGGAKSKNMTKVDDG